MTQPKLTAHEIEQLTARLITDSELQPESVEQVMQLPAFAEKMKACEQVCQTTYSAIDFAVQDALALLRLQQMTNTVLLNPLWKERLAAAGITKAPVNMEEWQQMPIMDKQGQAEYFMGQRLGLVVPLHYGGFEIVASGGTSSGLPVETVYSLRELHDTYKIAGHFLWHHMLNRYLTEEGPKWLATTLADYQMWSSGTMVGGVLQHTPNINYIGAGPMMKETYQHVMCYEGQKAIMGITASIALLADFGIGLPQDACNSFRVAMYGSGVLSNRKRMELKEIYPNISILSYFAATQAETIGLQLDAASSCLAAIPGLHLVEIVDENGRWVKEDEEGELVVTRLHAHETPLIRFKVGDRMFRRSNIDGPGLKTIQFEFSGRSGDVIHLRDTQYATKRIYDALCRMLKEANVLDLDKEAHEVQIINHRRYKTLSLIAAVDDVAGLNRKLQNMLGATGVHRLFIEALIGSLSMFNQGEANAYTIEKTEYCFAIKLVPAFSEEIFRTNLDKVPLLRDIF